MSVQAIQTSLFSRLGPSYGVRLGICARDRRAGRCSRGSDVERTTPLERATLKRNRGKALRVTATANGFTANASGWDERRLRPAGPLLRTRAQI
ncbi:hypothetical protein SKAU_G00359570 [Synaphobranchus kaupii]|uniref:Uncharacterized protein n=1 Tax=Synaphobranchus kaupii TaxID=118154 RepID=A0A9Q1EI01_SYNKA|nr:hypothetical protein SKAU_G00359570 [Synaphobranchus kaupii]